MNKVIAIGRRDNRDGSVVVKTAKGTVIYPQDRKAQ